MAVTYITINAIPCYKFSGAVTDSEIKTAWASLIVNGVYVLNAAIYLDNTADLTGVRGGFLVDFGTQVKPAFILHQSRDKTKSVFNNFTFYQRTGLSVNDRFLFVQATTNGTTTTQLKGIYQDGVELNGGGFVYAVPGNSGAGDSRYLNEMALDTLSNVTIMSQQFTEQELQPCVTRTTQLKGLTFQKCFGFPQIDNNGYNSDVRLVVYRSTENTEHASQIPIRLYPNYAGYGIGVCYIDSYVTRQGADVTTGLIDTYGAGGRDVNIMILNNYTRGSWFGTSKTTLPAGNWYANQKVIGGVYKKLQFTGGTNNGTRTTTKMTISGSTAGSPVAYINSAGFGQLSNYSIAITFSTTAINTCLMGANASKTTLSGTNDKNFYINPYGQIVWYTTGGTVTSTGSFNDGVKHCVIAVQGTSGMALYVDGVLVGSNSVTSNYNGTQYWHIGGGKSGQSPFSGDLYGVAIWETMALNATQAASFSALAQNEDMTGAFAVVTPTYSYKLQDASSSSTFAAYTGGINATVMLASSNTQNNVTSGYGRVRVYDSRSTTGPQRCEFTETGANDFLKKPTAPFLATDGKIGIVLTGAIATGASCTVTRYTGQKWVYQEWGNQVIVTDVDVTGSGDNDLSAYTPVTKTTQSGLSRTQSQVQTATSISNFQELLEELHNLAVTMEGTQSYNAYNSGNLFSFSGGELTTNFTSIVVDSSASSKIVYDYAANSLIIKSSTLSSNSTVTQWNNPSGTFTLQNGAAIQGVYQSSSGVSTILEISNIANKAAIFIGDATTHVADLQDINSTGAVKTYQIYYPPGSAGKQKLIARKLYGYLGKSETITLAEGVMSWTTTDTIDTVIEVTNQSTVSAYSVLDTPNKTYDYSRYQELTYPWLDLVSKDGNSLYFGNVNFKVNKTASNIWNYDAASNTLTVKATTFNKGSTMYEAKSDSLITTDNGATIAIPYQDSLGARGTILGLDPKGLGGNWHVRYRLQSATSWTELSGTGNSTAILFTSSGIYDIEAAANGYDRKTATLDTTSGVTVDISLSAQLAADETPQYLKAYDHTIASIFQYDAATGKVVVTNTSQTILQPSYAEGYQAIDRIMNDPDLVWSFSNPVKTNSVAQTITIPNGNPLEIYLSSNSNASVQLTCSVLLGTTGELAYSRLKGNAAGYMIILGSPADATSAGLKNSIVTELKTLLGGTNFDTSKHSLVNIKTELDAIQTSVDSLGI